MLLNTLSDLGFEHKQHPALQISEVASHALRMLSSDIWWAPGRCGGTREKHGVAAPLVTPLVGEAHSTCTLESGSGQSFAGVDSEGGTVGGVWLVARLGLAMLFGEASSSSLRGAGFSDLRPDVPERHPGDLISLGKPKPKDTLLSEVGLVGLPGDRGDRGESFRLCSVPRSLLFDNGEGGPNISNTGGPNATPPQQEFD